MYRARPFHASDWPQLSELYQAFSAVSTTGYGWDIPAAELYDLEPLLLSGAVEAFVLEETDTAIGSVLQGFLLYKLEAHRAVEVIVFYLQPNVPIKPTLDVMMRAWLPTLMEREAWDVVSYAMLGKQRDFIETITWYGFRPSGQTIQRLNLLDELTVPVLNKQLTSEGYPIPEGLQIESLAKTLQRPHALETLSVAIYEAFHTKTDALWDPRFRSVEGARQALTFMLDGAMGTLLSEVTPVLWDEITQEVAGFAYLIQSAPMQLNIPLIGLRPRYNGKRLGHILMQQLLRKAIEQLMQNKLGFTEINATMDTDNGPAIQLYRHFGFQEEGYYPHVALSRELAAKIKAGQWCVAPPF
jgi:ribosomal protein S18 acetylase RimI-like enzyme